ncbi:MAG: hypothetical protein NZ529_09105 [Cytophagaceae bacterium]|nr:hypothetical protein [Cytophagaceae bacterium]MDW8456942.1 hypothetical protein [Cytophagaceae bacterium]
MIPGNWLYLIRKIYSVCFVVALTHHIAIAQIDAEDLIYPITIKLDLEAGVCIEKVLEDDNWVYKVNTPINYIDSNGLRQGKWVFPGKIVSDARHRGIPKKVIIECSYKDGTNHGFYKIYRKNARHLLKVLPFSNGRMNGIAQDFFKNGKPDLRLTYVNDTLCGVCEDYSRRGKYIIFNMKNNRFNGEFRYFFSNNNLACRKYYVNDTLHGSYVEYSKKGKIKKEAMYQKGRETDTTRYYVSGKLKYAFITDDKGAYKEILCYKKNGRVTQKNIADKRNFLNVDRFHLGYFKR